MLLEKRNNWFFSRTEKTSDLLLTLSYTLICLEHIYFWRSRRKKKLESSDIFSTLMNIEAFQREKNFQQHNFVSWVINKSVFQKYCRFLWDENLPPLPQMFEKTLAPIQYIQILALRWQVNFHPQYNLFQNYKPKLKNGSCLLILDWIFG